MKHPTKRAVGIATCVVVSGFGAQWVFAVQPASTASRLLNSGFINHGAIKLRPNAPSAPVPTAITVDTTLNPMSSGSITPVGTVYTIGTNYGATAGSNEFFSFSTFNLGTGDTAQFMAANNIQNIISRVTGGTSSNIDGTIIAPGNFWFINPTGIIVTKNAVFDVSGSLALGSADYVSFTNGNAVDKFYADRTQPLALSMGTPASFGFLSNSQAGSFTSYGWSLLEVDSGLTRGVDPFGQFVPGNGNSPALGGLTIAGGSGVTLNDTTLHSVGASSSANGTVTIIGGLITLNNSTIYAENSGLAGADINLTASTGDISVLGGSRIGTLTSGPFSGGTVNMMAPNGTFILDHASTLLSLSVVAGNPEAVGGGNAGNIIISASNVMAGDANDLNSGPSIQSSSTGAGAGNIVVQAGSGTVNLYGAVISSATGGVGRSPGAAGNVEIDAGTLSAQNSNISSSSITNGQFSSGLAGNVSINTIQNVTLTETTLSSASSTGGSFFGGVPSSAGTVRITSSAGNIAMQSSSASSSVTSATFQGADVSPNANAGRVSLVAAGSVSIANNSVVESAANFAGNAGGVSVMGASVTVAQSKLTVSTTGNGNAGDIAVTAIGSDTSNGAALQVIGGSSITSDAIQGLSGAKAGNVTLTASNGTAQVGGPADSLSVPNVISTSAGFNAGQAGTISITAQNISLSDAQLLTTVATDSTADVNNRLYIPASVVLSATGASGGGTFTMADSLIDARTSGAVDAGSVTITGSSVSIAGGQQPLSLGTQTLPANTAIFSGTSSTGNAGTISVTAASAGTASVSPTSANSTVTLNNSAIATLSNGGGNAGAISIVGSGVLAENQSSLNADYENAGGTTGTPGTILVQATGSEASNAWTGPTVPTAILTQATPGVVAIVDSTISSTNTGGLGGIGGEILLGATPPANLQIASPPNSVASTDAVVISASKVTNSVSAGGQGSPLLINGTRGVWINGSSSILSTTDSTAQSPGQIYVLAGADGISIAGSTIDADNGFTGMNNSAPNTTVANIQITSTGGPVDLAGPTTIITAQTTGIDAGGDIAISGRTVSINGGTISASSSPTSVPSGSIYPGGNAGRISIIATGADPSSTTTALQIYGGAGISSTATGVAASANNPSVEAGNAGTIALTANTGSIRIGLSGDATQTKVSSSTGSNAGLAGTVAVTAGSGITLGAADIETTAGSTSAVGVGGNINVLVNDGTVPSTAGTGPIAIANSTLNASTSGTQFGGEIDLTGSQVAISNTKILSQTTGPADAGKINVISSGADSSSGAALRIVAGSTISSDANQGQTSSTNAGTVTLTASIGSVQVGLPSDTTQTSISSSTGMSAGAAGTVTITAANGIALGSANLSTTAGGTASNLSSAAPATIMLTANNGTGALSVANSTLNATTTGTQSAGQIDLSGSQITISNTDIVSATTSASPAGDIRIVGATVDILGGTGGSDRSENAIAVSTTGSGDAGSITISASAADPHTGSALQIDRMNIASTASLPGGAAGGPGTAGNAGTITINASNGSVALGDLAAGAAMTQIRTSADSSAGKAGTINISSAGTLTAQHTSVDTSVATTQPTDAHGNAIVPGTITLTAPGAIALTGSTLNATTSGNVAAGDIQVTAGGALGITSPTDGPRGGVSTSSTSTAGTGGAAGKITLAGAALTIDSSDVTATIGGGNASTLPADIALHTTGAVTVTGAATIKGDTSGGAPGGAIDLGTIAAPIASLTVKEGSTISVDASGNSSTAGRGGTLSVISAGAVRLSGNGTTLESNSSNDAIGGSVNVTASSLSMDSGAELTANTSSSSIAAGLGRAGNRTGRVKAPGSPLPVVTGGNVLVQTTGDVALTGAGTTISANAMGAGSGGTVTITSAGLSLTNGASIATTAAGSGNSGAIAVTVNPQATPGVPPSLVLAGNSSITTNSDASTGGNITVNAGGSPLTMNNSTIIATAGKQGNGGNITINNAGQTILQESAILAEADSGNGGAINIFLTKGALFVEDSQSLVSAQSAAGNNGTVTINSPQTNFNSALATPDVSTAKAPELASNACRRDKSRSTFVREGRGGVTPSPDGYQTSPPPTPTSTTAAAAPSGSPRLKDGPTLVAAAADVGCD